MSMRSKSLCDALLSEVSGGATLSPFTPCPSERPPAPWSSGSLSGGFEPPFGAPFGGASGAQAGAPVGAGSFVYAGWHSTPAQGASGASAAPGDGWTLQAQSFHAGSTAILAPSASASACATDETATTSFEIHDFGDPHQTITINDRALGQIDNPQSIADFETFHHTVGGATTISTQTTNQTTEGLSFNAEVDIQGGSWAVAATGNGALGATIQDARGSWSLQAGQSITENDGTVIANDGSSLVVTQHLQDGGEVTTTVSLNGAGYLDFDSQGHGDVGLSGWAADRWKEGG